jgi:hypothetical protein
MHERVWAFEGILASVVALVIVYYVLEPGVVLSRYGGAIGWSAFPPSSTFA